MIRVLDVTKRFEDTLALDIHIVLTVGRSVAVRGTGNVALDAARLFLGEGVHLCDLHNPLTLKGDVTILGVDVNGRVGHPLATQHLSQ